MVPRAGENPEGHQSPRLTDRWSVQSREGARPPTPISRLWEHSQPLTMPRNKHRVIKSWETRIQSPAQPLGSYVAPGKSLPLSVFFPSLCFSGNSVKWGNDAYLVEAICDHSAFTRVKHSQRHLAFRISRRDTDNGGGKEVRHLTHFPLSQAEGRLTPLHRTLVPTYEKPLASHKCPRLFLAKRLLPSGAVRVRLTPPCLRPSFWFTAPQAHRLNNCPVGLSEKNVGNQHLH